MSKCVFIYQTYSKAGLIKNCLHFGGARAYMYMHAAKKKVGWEVIKSQCNNYGIWQGEIKFIISYLARCVFFTNTKIIETKCFDEIHDKNHWYKNTHTLVKENTPCCLKVRHVQECGFTQKVAFFCLSKCFLPCCCTNIGMEVRLMLANTYQEIYDIHT